MVASLSNIQPNKNIEHSHSITPKKAYQEFTELGARASASLKIKKEGTPLEVAIFVQKILTEYAQSPEHAPFLAEFEALEKKYAPVYAQLTRKLSRLTSIQLRGQTGSELRHSLALISQHCFRLKSLDLSSTDVRNKELTSLPKCIKKLSLSSCKWLQEESLVALKSFRCLQELDLSYTLVTGRIVIFLPQTLEKLSLLGCHRFEEKNLVYIHPTIPLRTLDLRFANDLTGLYFDSLNHTLEHLILPPSFRFTFKNIVHLQLHPKLKRIDLGYQETIEKKDFSSLRMRALKSIQPRIYGLADLFAQEAVKMRQTLNIQLQDIAQAIFEKIEKEKSLSEETDEEQRFLMASHSSEITKKIERAKKQTLAITQAICRHTLSEKLPEIQISKRTVCENIIADLISKNNDDFSLHMKMQYGLREQEFAEVLALLEKLKEQAQKAEAKK